MSRIIEKEDLCVRKTRRSFLIELIRPTEIVRNTLREKGHAWCNSRPKKIGGGVLAGLCR